MLTVPADPQADDAVEIAEKGGYAWTTGCEDPEGRSPKEVVDAAFDVPGTLRGRATSTVHSGKLFSPARGATVAVCDDRLVLIDHGFTATLLIDELEAVTAAFTPAPERVAWAREVVRLLEGSGAGVAVLDGRMIDIAHLKLARRVLATAPDEAGDRS